MHLNNSKNGSATTPPLGGGVFTRLVYQIWECLLWVIWLVQRGRLNGNLPQGPVVLVANHGSYLDWLLLHVLIRRKYRRDIRFFAKEKIIKNRWFALLVEAASALVLRENKANRTMVMAVEALRSEATVIGIFPEGTRSRTGERLACSSGAAWLARKCSVPIVPVALCGFWDVWPPDKRWPTFKRVGLSVHILPPLNPADFADDQTAVDAAIDQAYAVVNQQRASK